MHCQHYTEGLRRKLLKISINKQIKTFPMEPRFFSKISHRDTECNKRVFGDTTVAITEWAGNSPDLSPNEKWRSVCEQRPRRLYWNGESIQRGIPLMCETSPKILQDYWKFVDSVPKWIQMMLKCRDHYTYWAEHWSVSYNGKKNSKCFFLFLFISV